MFSLCVIVYVCFPQGPEAWTSPGGGRHCAWAGLHPSQRETWLGGNHQCHGETHTQTHTTIIYSLWHMLDSHCLECPALIPGQLQLILDVSSSDLSSSASVLNLVDWLGVFLSYWNYICWNTRTHWWLMQMTVSVLKPPHSKVFAQTVIYLPSSCPVYSAVCSFQPMSPCWIPFTRQHHSLFPFLPSLVRVSLLATTAW